MAELGLKWKKKETERQRQQAGTTALAKLLRRAGGLGTTALMRLLLVEGHATTALTLLRPEGCGMTAQGTRHLPGEGRSRLLAVAAAAATLLPHGEAGRSSREEAAALHLLLAVLLPLPAALAIKRKQ